ncbi:hypothetical protein EBX93_04125, partial [bacterium]|nr:hypothetical protein [bacterium]
GTEGIGTGFSSYVPPFNPEDIRANIRRALKGEPLVKMTPWFRGFKGTVTPVGDASWVAEGVHSGSTITELPPGRWTQDYKEFLDELEESKVITKYVDNSTTEHVSFTVQGYTGDSFVKDFKLSKTIHATNMHLFHPKTGIKKYSSAEEILVDFVEVRLECYARRKAHLVHELTQKSQLLDDKARFIKQVVQGELVVFSRSRADIEADLLKAYLKGPDGTFDHLLHIKTYQYTLEAQKELAAAAEATRKELKVLKGQSAVDLWKIDL